MPKVAAGASPVLRGIHGICRAVGAIAAKKPAQVRTGLSSVMPNQAFAMRTTVWNHLSKALTSQFALDALRAAQVLIALEPFKSQQSLRASLGWELGQRHPEAFRNDELMAELKLGPEVIGQARMAGLGAINDPVAQLREFLGNANLEQLPEPDRGTAALFQGYLRLTNDPQRALEAFDRALALGADLGETLRGRWLATQSAATAHWDGDQLAKKVAEKAAERLTHLLERQPDGQALRTVLLVQLGHIQRRTENHDALATTLDTLRGLVQEQGYEDEPLDTALRTLESFLLSKSDPVRALEIVEPLLNQTNREPEVWAQAIALLQQLGRHADADAMVLRAAALSISPEFVRLAKKQHRNRRLASVPPESATAGMWANELRARFSESPNNSDIQAIGHMIASADLTEAKARFSAEARTACEAVTLCIVSTKVQGATLVNLAINSLLAAVNDGLNAEWIGAAALTAIFDTQDLLRFAKALAESKLPSKLVATIACWAAAAAGAEVARKVLLAVSPKLDAGALSLVRGVVSTGKLPPACSSFRSTMRDIGKVLRPEFDLIELVDGVLADGQDDDSDDDFDFDDEFDAMPVKLPTKLPTVPPHEMRKILRSMGLPKVKVELLSNAQLQQAAEVLMRCALGSPRHDSFEQLIHALSKFGFTPNDFNGMQPTPPDRRGKGEDTCPF